jgi:hypothetical protein
MILEVEILSNINATTTILCIHRIDVDNYNNLVLEKLFSSNEIFNVALDTNVFEFEPCNNGLKIFILTKLNFFAIGALVLITQNINMSKAIVNGAFAIITFIKFNENKIISSITIEIINIGFQLTLKQCNTYENNFYKVRFPILLDNVIIGHKAQQATISNKVVIKVRNSFALGLTYVMLL